MLKDECKLACVADIMEQHLKEAEAPSAAARAPEPPISQKSFAPVKKPNIAAAGLLLSESSDDDDDDD